VDTALLIDSKKRIYSQCFCKIEAEDLLLDDFYGDFNYYCSTIEYSNNFKMSQSNVFLRLLDVHSQA
jgi:hypothetical protein